MNSVAEGGPTGTGEPSALVPEIQPGADVEQARRRVRRHATPLPLVVQAPDPSPAVVGGWRVRCTFTGMAAMLSESAQTAADGGEAARRRLTARAVLVGLICVAGLSVITPYNDYYLQSTYIAGNFLPTGSLVVLLLLAYVVNPLLRLARLRAFRRGELATVWSVIIVASGIPTAGLWRYVIPQMVSARYLSNSANSWDEWLVPNGSRWLTVQSDQAAHWFYEGLPAGERLPWRDWALPLGTWLLIAVGVFFCMACLVAMLRRQWVEAERFTFPLVQMPLEVMQEPTPGRLFNDFARNRLVWAGAVIPLFLHTLSGLAVFYPMVPHFKLHYSFYEGLSAPPWHVIRADTQVHVYPAVTGLTYLLSSEVAAGFWLAFLFDRTQRVLLEVYKLLPSQVAITELVTHESYGATAALVLIALWTGRRHWRHVFDCACGRATQQGEEMLTYRVAFWGFFGGTALLAVGFALLGMPGWMTVPFLAALFMMYIGVSWAATNGGLPLVQLRYFPTSPLLSALGGGFFSPRAAVSTALLEEGLARDLRENPMPSLMNSQKLAHELQLPKRGLFLACGVGMAVAALVSVCAWLWLGYGKGAVRLAPGTFIYHAQTPWRRCTQWLKVGLEPHRFNLAAVALGGGLFAGLQLGRLTFGWWPIHPIGLIVMRSWCLQHFWFPILVGWAVKMPLVRYGGLHAYNKARPFFLGLILGDMIMAGVFAVVGFVTHTGYSVMPL